jgi:ABC-2 type transport system permease protein
MFRLFRAQLRRDRWQLLYWIIGSGLFAAAGGSAVLKEFATAKERGAVLTLASGNPSLLAIRGIPDGTSPGSAIFFEVFTYLAVLAALMSTFLTVRHSRGDEDAGRTELVRSTPVGRTAALQATLLLGLLANVAIVVFVAGGFLIAGLPAAGSVLAGLAAGGAGLAFCGIAALAAQLARTSRAANSIAGSLVGLAFLLRAVGDALGSVSKDGLHVRSAWPSWLSPIGWGQQTHAFGGDATPIPLLLDVALVAVAVASALILAGRRDLGAGLVGERAGRPGASRALRGSFGLAWRLQRNGVIGWALGGGLLGLFAGGLASPAVAAVKSNASVFAVVKGLVPGGTAGLLDTFVAAIMAFLGVLAAGAAIQAVLRARSEEAEGRAELVRSGSIGRARPLLDSVLVALLSIVVVLAAGGLFTGLAFLGAGHPERFGSSFAAAFVQLPAALVFVAVAALVFAALPRLTIGLGWGLLALGFTLGQFGALLKLPDWLRNVSPFSHTPIVPGNDIDWAAPVIMIAISVVVTVGSIFLVRRRDLVV